MVTTPALRLHHLRHCIEESVDHLSAGLRLERANSLDHRSYMKILRISYKFEAECKLLVIDRKGVIRFVKRGKLNPRYIGPFNIIAKKCLSDESLIISLDEIQVDDKLRFVEEPVKIMDREIKKLKRGRTPIIKVRWNSKRGPEFTWERED
ncbi:hypothetical protein Tco_1032330 [Tanacetum coccineum]|uniref:Reverse transcriptase domain-containing protein n=1 Tax=Tanacetum coccineum TaxID=301880 RepID=A0ABQ5GBR8_9ASTR